MSEKKKLLISIIIPYYKKKKFILQTLKSVIKQTFKNFEVIIIYDDSDLNDYYFIDTFFPVILLFFGLGISFISIKKDYQKFSLFFNYRSKESRT